MESFDFSKLLQLIYSKLYTEAAVHSTTFCFDSHSFLFLSLYSVVLYARYAFTCEYPLTRNRGSEAGFYLGGRGKNNVPLLPPVPPPMFSNLKQVIYNALALRSVACCWRGHTSLPHFPPWATLRLT